MDFGLKDARALLADPVLWPHVRDYLAAGGEFRSFPKGVHSRLCLVDAETRKQIDLWCDALTKVESWRTIVDGAKVRELKAAYPGVYPDVFRYVSYFARFRPLKFDDEDAILLLLKLKFPEVYRLCSS